MNRSASGTTRIRRNICVQVTPDDYATIAEKAESCGLPIAEFVRRCTLGRRTPSRVHLQIVKELRSLGMLQKELASEDGAGREHYCELFLEIQDAVQRVGRP
jgi:hypothetical protein